MSEQNADIRKLKLKSLARGHSADFRQDGTDENVFEFPFSSELAVERWFGDEVLSHDDGCADLARLNDAAPVLWNHNRDDMIGVVERAWIGTDKRGYCSVRFGTSQKAQEILSDVRAGVIRNVSFGYRINDLVESKKSGGSTFTATRWTPLEVSLVSIPADPTVGLGRDGGDDAREVPVRGDSIETREENTTMTTPATATTPVDEAALRADAAQAERTRITSIRALADKFPEQKDVLSSMIDSGRSIEDARAAVLESMGARQVALGAGPATGVVDLSDKETRQYSVVRAINAAVHKDWAEAGLELEVSRTLANELGRSTEGFFMPTNLRLDAERATYAVGAPTTGGNLVETQLLADSFIDILRNKSSVMDLGITMLSGLVGNVAIPRQTSATQTFWVTEGTAITQAEALFDQITLSPKQLGARSQYSRLALQQTTPGIEALVRADLAKQMALGIDAAAVSGTGTSGQPRGILNTSGIGSVAMGTNGAAFTNLDPLIDLERALDVSNALDGDLYYLTNARVIAMMKKLKDLNGLPLWTGDRNNGTRGTYADANGFPVARSNQIPNNLVKGSSGSVCSAMILGDFTQFVVGMWGGLEVLPNPFGAGYNSGAIDIRAMQTVDMNVRQPTAFAAITDILAA
jgi:HK97 family phage major capsid protein/HK97 family phage prohead protease